MNYKPVGVVHSPLKSRSDAPRQAVYGEEIEARVEIFPEYREGIEGLDNHSHLFLICHFNQSDSSPMKVTPPGESRSRGVFASRSPNHPNPIGLSLVKLISVSNGELVVRCVDMVDGTPILDIKPFIPHLDCYPESD